LSSCYDDPRDLPSFPTRRSSDLQAINRARKPAVAKINGLRAIRLSKPFSQSRMRNQATGHAITLAIKTGFEKSNTSNRTTSRTRSEEHTSELQSRENLVCRLLLE